MTASDFGAMVAWFAGLALVAVIIFWTALTLRDERRRTGFTAWQRYKLSRLRRRLKEPAKYGHTALLTHEVNLAIEAVEVLLQQAREGGDDESEVGI